MPTTKYKRRTLSIESQFDRLQTQWKNGQSGGGAWFWQHFKPVLLTVHEGNKELHLQCEHCSKLFSARNPSRTSLEHLKSGACNAFRRTPAYEEVKSSGSLQNRKKTRRPAKAEEGVLRRKRTIDGETMDSEFTVETRTAAGAALSSFFLESSLPASLLTHPRLLDFCALTGVPIPSPKQLLGSILDDRFAKICEENESRLKKEGVFQIAAEGWRRDAVTLTINFPDGNPAFLKTIELDSNQSIHLVDVLDSTTEELDSVLDRRNCLGWVTDVRSADRSAFDAAGDRYPWMILFPCQAFALRSLMKDLMKHIKIVSETVEMSQKVVRYFHSHPPEMATLVQRDPSVRFSDLKSVHPIVSAVMTLDSLYANRSLLQTIVLSEGLLSHEMDTVVSACLDPHFWDCVMAVHMLLHPILMTLLDVEHSDPFFSQMLDMWFNLQSVVQEWCQKHSDIASCVLEVFQKRFQKSYHPAMTTALLLDPGFCVKHNESCFLPIWHKLNPSYQSDANSILKKLSPTSRASRAATEFTRWQENGLPVDFGSVVSDKTLFDRSCLSKCVPMALRKTAWTSCLKDYESLGIVAHRLLSLKATAKGRITLSSQRFYLGPTGRSVQTKLHYVMNNSRLATGRTVDEALLDLDLMSDVGMHSDERELHSNGMDVDLDGRKVSGDDESQLYMQQLQLSSIPRLSSSVFNMDPPPLGTMPELPILPSLTTPVSLTMVTQVDSGFFASQSCADDGMMKNDLDPDLNSGSEEQK